MTGERGAEAVGQETPGGSDPLFDRLQTGQSIPDRFAGIVARFPDRLAISARGRRLTYRQLDAASDRLARRILARRGDAAEPLALLLDQGVDLVAAIFGALRAGKIWLALDPRHPLPELKRILVHGQPGLLVCDGPNRDLALELVERPEGLLSLAAPGGDAPDTGPWPDLDPDRPACIFYTSGSTGEPKGVVDSHRNVLHNVMRYTNSLRIDATDRLSLIQSCGFSGTVSSLFGALLNGAAIFPFDLQGQGIAAMAAWLAREEITIFHSVPAIFEQLAATGAPLPHLRLIRLEGDRSEPRHLRHFRERFGRDCVLVNGLGATETGIVRQFFFDHDSTVPETLAPIGYPAEDMEIHLLDDEGGEVATGEVGEIVVASHYLALGYWRRPDLTRQAFRVDPADPDRRLYRTGDLGLLRPDGCLEYLGRKDFQARIRGNRIDTAAVEAALARRPGIEQALVMVREDRPGTQQLVAWLTTAEGGAPGVSTLCQALARSLPEIMIPARYVFLDRFPLDRNRKLDRRALPPPGRRRPDLDTPWAAPVTHRQKLIAACFGEALGLDAVGLHDDFFELGGDSLLATGLVLLVEDRLGLLCSPDFLFSAPSVAGMDRSLGDEASATGPVPLRPGGSRPALFCLHNLAGYVLEYRHLARLLGPGRPVWGLQNEGLAGSHEPPPRVEDMAATALAEILRLRPEGPFHLCGNCFGGLVALEVARLLRAGGHEVGHLALFDTGFPGGGAVRTMITGFRSPRPIGRYRDEMAGLPPARKVAYLAARLGNLCHRVAGRAGRLLWFGIRRLVRALGARGLRPRVLETSRSAQDHYRPGLWDGPVTLYSPGPPRDLARWQGLLPRLRVVQLDAGADPDRRPHLVQEPFVHDLAELLDERLDASAG